MSSTAPSSNVTAPTQFLQVKGERYAYRRFGRGSRPPLLFLGAGNGGRHGDARIGFPRRPAPGYVRRPRILARRDGGAADGARPPLDPPEDDPRRYRSARWRRHHAPRKADPGQVPGGSKASRTRGLAKDLLRADGFEPGSGRGFHRKAFATQAVSNSYRLGEHLPNAVLLTYPDSGHGSLFQFHESFTRQAAAFLASDSPLAPY